MRKTASLTLENLNGVIEKYKLFEFTLLADDGSENKGCVKEFIKNTQLNIDLQIAQCDISFSNSMVEAVFRTLKLYYWPVDFEGTPEKATETLEKCINNYNELRPHRSHNGLTPYEALKTDEFDRNDIVPIHEIRNAAKRRVIENRNSDCRDCEKL